MAGIRVNNLTFTYPNQERPVLKDINIDIAPASWTAIIGHNGSGKSTLVRLIDGLLIPDKGTIEVNGINVDENSLGLIHQQIGFVFQNPENQFVGATVADDVAFGLENRRVPPAEMKKRIHHSLEMVGMLDYQDAEPVNLSGGQKQRVALAGVLSLMPQVIILDEATSMLDPLARQEILSLLTELRSKQNISIISITHDINEIELADETIILDEARVAKQGPTKEVLKDGALLDKIGVGLPAGQQLKQLLAQRGINVPDNYFSLEEIKQWLTQQLQ
ncbi:energy-coupling factor transporter ATPase [Limosilactobacillus caccae]|uniref:energy-coupling factor transporter ATPase n=1 Tax=Limosilactobacillus caccae TaxID=1926284 RepID=UPI0009710E1B|nr:energy-coupling factor transporter ATPase [Limosilactobacillus caccae]